MAFDSADFATAGFVRGGFTFAGFAEPAEGADFADEGGKTSTAVITGVWVVFFAWGAGVGAGVAAGAAAFVSGAAVVAAAHAELPHTTTVNAAVITAFACLIATLLYPAL